jgi:hypothetical protein
MRKDPAEEEPSGQFERKNSRDMPMPVSHRNLT